MLIFFYGLTGSGKSTVARFLEETYGAVWIRSDEVRKDLVGIEHTKRHLEAFGKGIYSPEMTEITYREMISRARDTASQGKICCLDASFGIKRHRAYVLKLANKMNIPYILIRTHAPDHTIRKRLDERMETNKGPSDGRWEIYVAQKKHFEPPEEIPKENILDIDTSKPFEDIIRKYLKGPKV